MTSQTPPPPPPPPPPKLDYTLHTYFTVSVSVGASSHLNPPSILSSSSSRPQPEFEFEVKYLGAVGALEGEYLYQLTGVPSASEEEHNDEKVQTTKRYLEALEGVKGVEVMRPRLRKGKR